MNRTQAFLLAVFASAIWQLFWLGIQNRQNLFECYVAVIVAVLLCIVVIIDLKKKSYYIIGHSAQNSIFLKKYGKFPLYCSCIISDFNCFVRCLWRI